MDKKSEILLSESEISNMVTKILAETTGNSHNTTELSKGLTAGEASNLWTQYMGNSLGICMYEYFLHIVDDQEIKEILEISLKMAQDYLSRLTQIFNQSNYMIPLGFTKEDVNIDAPRLFSDSFLLYYSEIMLVHALNGYSIAISTSESKNIRKHFQDAANEATELLDKTIELAKRKGEFSSSPIIPSLKEVEFIRKTGILTDLFGEPGPLYVSEIHNIFFNLKKSFLAKALNLAFSQVAQSPEVRNYLSQLNKTTYTNVEIFSSILEKDNLTIPRSWDTDITDSTVSPFSDKLIMMHIGFLASSAMAYYGTALASSIRTDVTTAYTKAILNIIKECKQWLTIMVENGWLEKQPHAIDRRHLSQVNT